uniref:Uncharacterized protein n=1 Tax=Parascaris univalens TaxID=6257 RepID=A0A915BJL5_PARUN
MWFYFQAANEGPKRNVDLDELAQLNEKLLERSRGRRADYKLVDSEIIKTAPEPVTPNLKQPRVNPATVIQEQIREMLESRISNDTSVNSTIPQQDRSGYVTDVSSATWQFSTQSFSPRSVVSINGGGRTDDGLLKVRTDLSPELSRTMSRSNAAVQTAQIEGEKQQWPYMPAQLGSVADSAQSTMTREFNESFTRRIDRYASLPTLDASDARGTLIKIKDDKPRGIMKRRELETKDQMMYVEQPKNIVRQNQWEQREIVQTKPKVTETVQKFEEHKRTEEIERRVQRKERREKKHRSAQRSYHHSGGQEMLGYSDGEEIRIRKAREAAETELLRREAIERAHRLAESQQRRSNASEWHERSTIRSRAESLGSRVESDRRRAEEERRRLEYERRQAEEERRRAELERRRLDEQYRRAQLERSRGKLVEEHEKSESLKRSNMRTSRGSQTDRLRERSSSADPVHRVERIYERRRFSPSELNEAVRNAYRAVEQAHNNLRYRSSSLSRNGYLPAHESYMRTVTTRRERDGRYSDDGRYHTNGSARYGGSISDSLRRGEMKYNPNGEIREVHHTSSARNGRVHKSYSTRDVFDSGNYDDRRSSFSYRRGSQQGGPFVEFPPTLPRVGADHEPPMPPPHRGRAASNDFYRPITKSRSYADWDEGRGFTQAIKRRDEDMARLENEFRDSLLMPLPTGGGNMYERDHRHEQIPGGYETYDREVKSSSGRRLNRDGNPTQFSEASQEYSYKREQETDRRR